MREPGANPGRSRRCEGSCSSAEDHWPARPGRRREGSPESEDLPRCRAYPNPSRKEDSCVRRLIVLAGRRAARLRARLRRRRSPRVNVRVEGKTTDDLRLDRADARRRAERAAALDAASAAGEFYYHVQSDLVRPVRRPDRPLPRRGDDAAGCYKVNGVSPPVGADQATLKDGDTVLWYWSTFTEQGGLADAAPAQAQGAQLLHGRLAERPGRRLQPAWRATARRRAEREDPRRPWLRRQASRPRPRDVAERGALERAQVKACPPRRPCARPAARLRARAHGLGERDAVGHARPRRERARRAHGAGWTDGDAGPRPRAGREDDVQRTVRAVDRGHRRRRLEAARLVLVPERHRGRSQRRRLPPARGDVEWWDFRSWRGRCASRWSSARSPSRSCHGYDGHVRPAAVRYAAGGCRRYARSVACCTPPSVAPLSTRLPWTRMCFTQ